jgi:uncharacterized phiE125 gp8 family phage protein
MATRSITPPATEPVTLAEAKLLLRIDHADDDTLIEGLITAAREQCEHIIGRSLLEQTWEKVMDSFPNKPVELFYPPIIEVESVKYVDSNTGVETTLASDRYRTDVDSEPGLLGLSQFDYWPATQDVSNAVRITYTAGYADADAVPQSIKNWIKLAVAHLYERCDTEGSGVIPVGFYGALLDRYRVWSL